MFATNKTLVWSYLSLTIVGAVVPYIFFIKHFATAGFGAGLFLNAIFANSVASGFTADLLISSLVFWIAISHRYLSGRGPGPLLFVVLNLTIGLSCALPAYLFANERRKLAAAAL